MPRRILGPHRCELVRPYVVTLSEPDLLGQRREIKQLGKDLIADVQPLGSELRLKYGLRDDREALRIQLSPAVDIEAGAVLQARERDWRVLKAEHWQHHSVLIAEEV